MAVNNVDFAAWQRCRSAELWWTPKANRRGRGVLSDGCHSFQVDRGSTVLLVCIQRRVWTLRRWLFGAMERLRVWGGGDSGVVLCCLWCGIPHDPGNVGDVPLNPEEILRLIRPTEMCSTGRAIAVECRVWAPTHYVIRWMSFPSHRGVFFHLQEIYPVRLVLFQSPNLPTSLLIATKTGWVTPCLRRCLHTFPCDHNFLCCTWPFRVSGSFLISYYRVCTSRPPLSIHGKRVYCVQRSFSAVR